MISQNELPAGRLALAVIFVSLLAGIVGCAPVYHMNTPEGFVRYEKKKGLAFITPDGVRLHSRTVRNYPKADLLFWADAMERHLTARGYLLHAKRCFTTKKGLGGCTAEFVVPHGAEDWMLAETIFVLGDDVALLEAAGPFARYQRVAPALSKEYEGFAPEY
jgi:hypothetical protein